MRLTPDLIEGFAAAYLSPRYDQPHPTAEFQRLGWSLYCDPELLNVALAAPRRHGKSSSFTDAFVLAAMLFRFRRYGIIISASEDTAIEHLGGVAEACRSDEAIQQDFGIRGLVIDQRTDIVVECEDGYQFRLLARGSGQKIRGRKWQGMRPDLLVGDDLESDDDVTSREIRRAFRRWFFRVAKQLLGEGGLTRIHGTILHDDSLLWHLTHNASWSSRVFKAHRGFSDFSEILWPERFAEAELRAIRQEFIEAGDPQGYSQEYLNDPRDRSDPYLAREWFTPMAPEDYASQKVYAVGVDLAISKSDSANRTAMVVGGRDLANILHIVDVRAGRWDASEIIEKMFEIERQWHPVAFFIEGGAIWQAISPVLRAEMARQDVWLNILPRNPTKDKAARGRAKQKRMRSGGMRFDKRALWYPEYEEEELLFTAEAEALSDDIFDASSWLCIGCEELAEPEAEDELTEEEQAWLAEGDRYLRESGRSAVTGY